MQNAWVTGSDSTLGNAVVKALQEKEITVHTHPCRKAGDLCNLPVVKVIASGFLPLDLLICCAGGVRVREKRPENDDCLGINNRDLQAIFNNNVLSAINCAKAVAPSMLERKTGQIVFVGSDIVGKPRNGGELAAYSLSKAALHDYSLCLAKQLHPHVQVSCIAPATIGNEVALDTVVEAITQHKSGLLRLGKSVPLL